MLQMAKILLLSSLRKAPTNIPYFHPKIMPVSIIGTKLKLIVKNCVFIVNNLSNIINIASNNAANIVFLLCEILYSVLPATLSASYNIETVADRDVKRAEVIREKLG